MHYCLKISEIVVLICEAFTHHDDSLQVDVSKKSSAALAALARTCQSFHSHALDVLWRSQTTLIPLIKCFPADAWEHEGPGPIGARFRRPLVRQDWDRVTFYAYRIKALGFNRAIHVLAPLEIWQTLELSRPSDMPLLLPNLRRLSWFTSDEIFPYIRMLLGPNISQLRLYLHENERYKLSILPILTSLCPNLTGVEFFTDKESTIAEGIISSTIMRWNSLESLNVSSLTTLAMHHIASLPKLRCLHLRGYQHMPHPRLLGRTGPTFPALQVLRLTGPNMPDCASLISTISPSQLREVTIQLPGRTTSNLWKRIFVALDSSGNTLTDLNIIERSRPIGGSEDEWTVGWDCLKPLTALHSLKKVVLEPVGGLDLDNGQFEKLVSEWPMLEHLELGLLYNWFRPSRITLAGLVPLVEKCPNLGRLGLNINATECPAQIAQTIPSNNRLTTMSVGSSPIGDPVGAAQFLHGLFPQLSATKAGCSRPTGFVLPVRADEAWCVASKVLRFMRDHPGETPPPVASGRWL